MNKNLLILLSLISTNSYAAIDKILHESSKCEAFFSQYEEEHSIPKNILKAISLTETGIWHNENKQLIPWPWSVNAAGKSYYYDSKAEAIRAVKKFYTSGIESIDVGCMQINLKYHPDAFDNLEEAFDPKKNIEYSANFLKKNYSKHDNWRHAIASYHSENSEHGVPYLKRVLSKWDNLAKSKPIASYNTNYQTQQSKKSLEKKRRTSNLFIKVSNNTPYKTINSETNNKEVEAITKSALKKFGSSDNTK